MGSAFDLEGLYFCYANDLILGASEPGWRPLTGRELLEAKLEHDEIFSFGQWGEHNCYAVVVNSPDLSEQSWSGLRQLVPLLDEGLFGQISLGCQLVRWRLDHTYCGRCAAKNVRSATDWSMHCPACRLSVYPRISPCIIVVVRSGAKILLARSSRFAEGLYSAIAGFVEPAETLESAVAREVREEVGVEVHNIRYFGSQPWPFPHQLMIAFHADYLCGEIRPDGVEIVDARWFSADSLPSLPPPHSISRKLIDSALGSSELS